MSLKLSNGAGTFDLPKDFSTEIEDSSPIYNERGSQSIAANIPGTTNNLRLNNHINRMDIDSVPTPDSRITIADGVYHRVGKMNIVNASKKEGITFNIGFGESELYSLWNEISLQSLNLPVYKPGGVTELCTYLEDVYMRKKTDEPLAVFPISVSFNQDQDQDYHEYLNNCRNFGDLAWQARTETFFINGSAVNVSLPAGYGVTPFLKIHYIIETIFSNYGYTVIENPFSTHHQLKWLVALNNSADCCVKGELKYADLMPDCTINEFLQALWCRFGLLYFVDGKTRTVRLKLIRDILNAPASEDWSLLKASEPISSFEAPQQLKLSASTNIKGPSDQFSAAPAAESLDKFLKPYHYIVSTKADAYLLYRPNNGLYYKRDYISGRNEFVSTDFFAWDRGADLPYKEISSIDESLPVITGGFGSYHCMLPLYLFGKVHRYTSISSSDIELSENLNSQTPLCFCFAFPESVYTEGSSICLDLYGKPKTDGTGREYDISLIFVGKYGLFNHFWREYDAVLRHANHVIENEIHLSTQQCMNLDFSSPILLDGQRMFPDSVRYTLPKHQTSPATVKLRTIKLLKPYDLDKEQNVPIVDQLYTWKLFDNKSSIVSQAIESQVELWKSKLDKDQTIYDLKYENTSTDAVDTNSPLSVPTEEDYINKQEYFIRKVNYSFELYYRIRTYLGTSGGVIRYDISDPKGGVHYEVQYDQSIRAELL